MRLALNVTSVTVSLEGLNKSVSGGGRELISPKLYCRWAHVQPLARCLSGQSSTMESKDLKLPLQVFCNLEGIPMTLPAIWNTVLAPRTCGFEGQLARSLFFFATMTVMYGAKNITTCYYTCPQQPRVPLRNP